MIHYVREHDPVGTQFACGLWPYEHDRERVTIFKRSVTCAKCRKVLGLKPRKPTKSQKVIRRGARRFSASLKRLAKR